jgi:hypothetical protein
MTTFRALCAELLQPLSEYDSANPYHEHRDLITRARAELAKPEPVGPSLEDLGPLISWLTESATQSADAGRSTDAGMLTWAAQVVGERVDEDAPEPEPQGPTAWMYRGEPDFDGERWRESWKVTLDEKLARYMSGNKEPVPLWDRPAIEPVPQGPTSDELRTIAAEFAIRTAEEFTRAVLARWGRPATDPTPVSERPWERDGWCDAQGTCWMWHPINFHYCLCRPDPSVHTHSLPHWVLPLPIPESTP